MREGWVANGHQWHNCFCRQQGGEGVMIWPRMIGDGVLVHIGVIECVKIASLEHCQLLESTLLPGLADFPILKRCKLNFQDDISPSHLAKEMQILLPLFG